MNIEYDVIVVGAGIVGLATGMKLLESSPGIRLLMLDKEGGPAFHQTGHNSGVMHSGIYYRPGSLKAKNCVEGSARLREFCDQNGIDYEICGKVIVATRDDEIPRLQDLYRRGEENGLKGLRMMTQQEIAEREPHAAGIAAIMVPQTGIIDFRDLARKFEELIVEKGGDIIYGSQVSQIRREGAAIGVEADGAYYRGRALVTCAGLNSDRLARQTDPALPMSILPFRGEYYELKEAKRHLVKHLIYPVPDPAFPFLGVHFTRMIGGKVEAGPNAVLAFKREGYKKTDFSFRDTLEIMAWPGFRKIARKYWRQGSGEIHRSLSKKAFVSELQRLIPEISRDDLEPGGAGVRAQACHRDGSLLDDFFIDEQPHILHVCNAPSPAATSSLSIGATIADRTIVMLG